ncbi:hypothetical protein QOT17_021728 [Balamuthia mandrillaris]
MPLRRPTVRTWTEEALSWRSQSGTDRDPQLQATTWAKTETDVGQAPPEATPAVAPMAALTLATAVAMVPTVVTMEAAGAMPVVVMEAVTLKGITPIAAAAVVAAEDLLRLATVEGHLRLDIAGEAEGAAAEVLEGVKASPPFAPLSEFLVSLSLSLSLSLSSLLSFRHDRFLFPPPFHHNKV